MMDTETKEAVLKLAGYEVVSERLISRGYKMMRYEVIAKHDLPIPVDRLSRAETRSAAISIAYNTFLTRQNDVS